MTTTSQQTSVVDSAFSFAPDAEHHRRTMQGIVALRLCQLQRLAGLAGRLRGTDAAQVAGFLSALPELDEAGRLRLVREPFFHACFVGMVTALREQDEQAARRCLDRLLAALLPAATPLLPGPLVLHAGPRGTLGFGATDDRLRFGSGGVAVTVTPAAGTGLDWSSEGRHGTVAWSDPPAGVLLDGGDERLPLMLAELAGDPTSFSTECVQPVPATDQLRNWFERALQQLAAGWPAMHAEIAANAGLAVPIQSVRTAAFSNTAWQGAIFLRDEFTDPLFLIERIVHESSHLRLNAFMAGTPMHEHSWDERVDSPFRTGPRPVTGLLHGAFVFTRAALALVRSTAGTAEQERAAAQALALTNKVGTALEVIRSSVRLTQPGRGLVGEIGQVCQQIEATHHHIAPAVESSYLQGEM